MVIPATACLITHPMPWATGTAAVGIEGEIITQAWNKIKANNKYDHQ